MYAISADAQAKIENNFTYHAPKPEKEQATRYTEIRGHAKTLAEMLSRQCPPSRELSLAITKLAEVMFWANAAIARNE